ncbi:MAG: D-alanyl-D-alanine carboxypeptidase/D-alanyl-D-alanine-endopeptidase [Verrucomicrobia bacterium]|nr:D-alanyl-D-alanine carboxypeptidase/D-alanyl-D-alanine-endopeptidase [Verrucomicrobiota bacterium]
MNQSFRLLFFCAAVFWASLATSFSQNDSTNKVAAFQEKLKAFVEHPRFDAALFGVKVESLDTGKVIYENAATKLLKPASNAKIYTGALALDRLGADHKIRTSFYATAPVNKSGTINGDLIVYGRGDPSLSHRFNNGDYTKAFDQLVDALADAGVKRIKGNLVGDDSFFRGAPYGSNWSWEDFQYYYGAEVSALTLQENVVDLVLTPGEKIGDPVKITTKPESDYLIFFNRTETVAAGGRRGISVHRPVDQRIVYLSGTMPLGDSSEESVAVHNATLWFVHSLKNALQKRGIQVSGETRTINWLDRDTNPFDASKYTEIAHVESRPMAEMVKNMMKPSQNLYAQLLLLQVAEKFRTPENKRTSSENLGLAEMKKFLAEAGVGSGDVLLEEGSGLSRGCLLKPASTIQLLKYMSKHRDADAFMDSLPLAGVDGTLRSRFKGTPAENNLRAKTGTIRYVSSLSGFVTTKARERLVFSIMLNNYSGGDGRSYTDQLGGMLATLDEKTGN